MEGPGHLGGSERASAEYGAPLSLLVSKQASCPGVLKAEDVGGDRGQGSHSEACPHVVNTTKGTPRTDLPWVPGEDDPFTLE